MKIKKRASGILLHISSLPSAFGIGDLGPEAFKFVDFLNKTKQSYWQILPLNPTENIFGNCPYSSFSAFACNPLFISPEVLMKQGWLTPKNLTLVPLFQKDYVDYDTVSAYKTELFETAFENFKKSSKDQIKLSRFCQENRAWIDDFALFIALKEHFTGQDWSQWPQDLRDRKPEALKEYEQKLADRIQKEKFLQYAFSEQWTALKTYCKKKRIQLIGDIPIYVNYDSADVWAHPGLFKLDKDCKPIYVSGVPPDYFSATGQRWGNPVYYWAKLRQTKYAWWIQRIERNLKLIDIFRIDHFRGFAAFWQIPVSEPTAVNGQWVKAPGRNFLATLTKRLPDLSIIAEDLGIITPDVTRLMKLFGLPGMKVLLFAFNGDLKTHPYIPDNYTKDCVVFTGTHDNNTARGWFENEATEHEKENLFRYLRQVVTPEDVSWEFVKMAMKSNANTAIIPLQDLLELGQEARMNIPGSTKGNWLWRFSPNALSSSFIKKFQKITVVSKRA